MKKKVKDLDPVLMELIFSIEEYRIKGNVFDLAQPYLDKVNWKLATNEERLKYAELMYYEGVVFKNPLPEHPLDTGKSSGKFMLTDHGIADSAPDGSCVYDARSSKWAPILSRPDEKEETKEPVSTFEIPIVERKYSEFVKKFLQENNGYDLSCLSSEEHEFLISIVYATLKAVKNTCEFQPGEMVEVRCDHPDWEIDEWGKTAYFGFLNGKHVCHIVGGRDENKLYVYDRVRKIQPDPEKEIKAKVKILIEENFKRKDGPETPLQIVSFERGRLESMLIEAFKTEVK